VRVPHTGRTNEDHHRHPKAALEAANDFLNLKMLFVTISADGRIYTAEEFATTMEGVRER